MIWLQKEMYFLVGFSTVRKTCPCLFVYNVCCAWHLLHFPPLCVPLPTGRLGVRLHVIKRFRKFSSLSPLAYPIRAEKATKCCSTGRVTKCTHTGDKTAAVGMGSFRGPVKEEDKEIMAHGWQMDEVWLEIRLSRNILS